MIKTLVKNKSCIKYFVPPRFNLKAAIKKRRSKSDKIRPKSKDKI